jgi:hypothetical protein
MSLMNTQNTSLHDIYMVTAENPVRKTFSLLPVLGMAQKVEPVCMKSATFAGQI